MRSPIRIAIIAGFSNSLINFRGPLVKALRDEGLEVHALAPALTSDDVTRNKLEEWGVLVHDVPMQRAGINPLKDLNTLMTCIGVLRGIKPDIVLSYTIKPVIYGTLSAWLVKVPRRYALITGLGYAFTGATQGKRKLVQCMARGLYREALKRTQLVYFQNPDDEALFRKLQLLPDRIPSKI